MPGGSVLRAPAPLSEVRAGLPPPRRGNPAAPMRHRGAAGWPRSRSGGEGRVPRLRRGALQRSRTEAMGAGAVPAPYGARSGPARLAARQAPQRSELPPSPAPPPDVAERPFRDVVTDAPRSPGPPARSRRRSRPGKWPRWGPLPLPLPCGRALAPSGTGLGSAAAARGAPAFPAAAFSPVRHGRALRSARAPRSPRHWWALAPAAGRRRRNPSEAAPAARRSRPGFSAEREGAVLA